MTTDAEEPQAEGGDAIADLAPVEVLASEVAGLVEPYRGLMGTVLLAVFTEMERERKVCYFSKYAAAESVHECPPQADCVQPASTVV